MKNAFLVSQKGTLLTAAERKSITGMFATGKDFFPRNGNFQAGRFADIIECLSLQGLRPANYSGRILQIMDGRPFWDDISMERAGEKTWNFPGMRTALENVAIIFEGAKLNEGGKPVELHVMIASHSSGKKENSAFSVRYQFSGNSRSASGSLLVSGGKGEDGAVSLACDAYVRMHNADTVFLSLAADDGKTASKGAG